MDWRDLLLTIVYKLAPLRVYRGLAAQLKELGLASSVCDVGGGRGNLYRALSSLNTVTQYVLVDPSRRIIEEAPRGCTAEVVEGVAEALPLRSSACKTIVFFDALHHFTSPSTALEEAARVAECLAVEDVDASKPAGKLVEAGEKLLGYPARFTSYKALAGILESMGFKIVWGWRGRLALYRLVGCRKTG